jgi:hypothetical protein
VYGPKGQQLQVAHIAHVMSPPSMLEHITLGRLLCPPHLDLRALSARLLTASASVLFFSFKCQGLTLCQARSRLR